MKQRCSNFNHKSYWNYGGKGIRVCHRWLKFKNFFEDMGQRPSIDYSIDRVNPHGNYEPSNCRWILKRTNSSLGRRHPNSCNKNHPWTKENEKIKRCMQCLRAHYLKRNTARRKHAKRMDVIIPLEIVCRNCSQKQPSSNFVIDRYQSSGHVSYCNPCYKIRRQRRRNFLG